MATWTPNQRYLALHRLLSKGKKVVASQLAREWGRSDKTVFRDLERMRDEQHLPIEYDAREKTWRYTAPVTEISTLLVSVEDRRALLFSLQAATQLADTPVSKQVRHLYAALLSTLPPETQTDFERMMRSVRFTGPRTPDIKKQVWDVMLLALEARETISITYTDGVYASTTQREIDPYGLLMRDRRWNVVAHCHRTGEVLTFSLFRISEAVATEKPFKVSETFMDDYLADHFDGYQSSGKKLMFTLKIRKDAPPFISERVWGDNETRRTDETGSLIVEFQTAAIFAVEREVCANAPWVEVVAPVSVRLKMLETGALLTDAHR